jgi:hypothetical protein
MWKEIKRLCRKHGKYLAIFGEYAENLKLFRASSADFFFIDLCPACCETEEGGEREKDSWKIAEEYAEPYSTFMQFIKMPDCRTVQFWYKVTQVRYRTEMLDAGIHEVGLDADAQLCLLVPVGQET